MLSLRYPFVIRSSSFHYPFVITHATVPCTCTHTRTQATTCTCSPPVPSCNTAGEHDPQNEEASNASMTHTCHARAHVHENCEYVCVFPRPPPWNTPGEQGPKTDRTCSRHVRAAALCTNTCYSPVHMHMYTNTDDYACVFPLLPSCNTAGEHGPQNKKSSNASMTHTCHARAQVHLF